MMVKSCLWHLELVYFHQSLVIWSLDHHSLEESWQSAGHSVGSLALFLCVALMKHIAHFAGLAGL